MGKRFAIHASPGQPHQLDFARALQSGFAKHAQASSIDTTGEAAADVHVCLGPWFALKRWQYDPQVLYLDRCYWGDPASVVSLHWLENAEKCSTWNTAPRPVPQVKPYRQGPERAIYLCDYGEFPPPRFAHFRRHPEDKPGQPTLQQHLEGYTVAHGRRTTALVAAAIEGLQVVSVDRHSPVYPISGQTDRCRITWLKGLAWHNWSRDEIASGAAWEYLKPQ